MMKRLYRSRKEKKIEGVCGGIAEYFEVDPTLIRVIAVVFLFVGGAALIAYIVGAIIIPLQPLDERSSDERTQQTIPTRGSEGNVSHIGSLIIGVLLILFGVHSLLRHIPYYRRFYELARDFWPVALIVIGLLVILRSVRKYS
jgi:phage shock protein C